MGILDWFRKKDPEERFANLLRRELLKAGETRPIVYDKNRFCLDVGKDHVISLRNAYEEYCAAPEALRAQLIARYTILRLEVEIPKTFQEALPNLIPRVRQTFFFSSMRLVLEAEGRRLPDFAFKPLTDHFGIELAYDLPEQSMQVLQHQLQEWKVSLDEALPPAHENLVQMTTVPLKPLRPGLYASPWNDTYAPSRLLLPEYLASHPVRGEPVVAVPNRDLLLLTGSQDAEGLEEMARRVHQAQTQPRFMTGHALVWSEGAWSLFTPDPDHPAHTDFMMLRQSSMASFYEEQKTSLDKIHEAKGIDIYVASITLLRNKATNQIRSFCTWAEGVDSLLPEADDVVFKRADASGRPDPHSPAIVVPWEAARSRLGDLMVPALDYPPRYRVNAFPSMAVLREIGKEI